MHPFFTVSALEVAQLNDEQARELVAQLCKAELSRKSISTSAVSWGGNQRAKDGGIDVSVDVKIKSVFVDYIPRATTGFQVKAEYFPPSKIPGEMLPSGILRESIGQLIDQSGAYIIVSTKDACAGTALNDRIQKMEEMVKSHLSFEQIKLDFYDSQKIADWASNYPGIVVWIKGCLGDSLQSWEPYGPWAYKESDVSNEYLLDNKVKVSIPKINSGLDVQEAINSLRGNLGSIGASVRIVGLSGVGKTRLVQALFDDRIVTTNPVLASDNVIYTDLSNSPNPLPYAILEALIIANSDCIVVIDNCGQDVHQKLTELVKRPDSKLKLITVEYDIRDHQPESTHCYHLEGSSNEVIAKLLRRHFNSLSDLDVDKIVEFSDGNARIAFALASTSETQGELAKLHDEDLFKRLFIQKHIENDELQRCAEAASLLYSFDVDNLDATSELSTLAGIAEVTVATFYRHVAELFSRGLVQARGEWRAVLPHAIANRLAIDALKKIPVSILINSFILSANERVARSHSRRLGYLHESKDAQKIVSKLMGVGGIFYDVANLEPLQWEIFENLAPVNQSAALDAILRVIQNNNHASMQNFLAATKLLRSLAYESELFEKAVKGLLEFSLSEPTENTYDQPIGRLQSLFYANLSGTLALPEQRASFIRSLVFHNDSKHVDIGLQLLEAALDINYPSGTYSYEFGALSRTYGLATHDLAEIGRWFPKFIQIAVEIGIQNSIVGSRAREILGSALRGLWVHARMEDELINAAHEFSKTTEWIRGWIGVRVILRYDSKVIANESLVKLKTLEKLIGPKDIHQKIQAKILSQGVNSVDLDDLEDLSTVGRYTRAFNEAIDLGKIVGQDNNVISDFEPFVRWQNTTNKLQAFGLGIGESTSCPQHYVDQLKPFYKAPHKFQLDYQFLGGLIQGWHKARPAEVESFLDDALEDEIWGPLFLNLQLALNGSVNLQGYERILKSLDLGLVNTARYSNLGNGRPLDNLTVLQITAILSKLACKPDKGLDTAIDVLYMVIFGATANPPKDDQYKSELSFACLDLIRKLDWNTLNYSDDNLLSHLETVIDFALESTPISDHTVALENLLSTENAREPWPKRIGVLLVPFLKRSPITSLNLIFKTIPQESIYRILTLSLVRAEQFAIHIVPDNSLLEWCKESPDDRYIFAANTCLLFGKNISQDEFAQENEFSSIAIQIFNLAPNKSEILKIFVARSIPYSWSGSRSAIMTQRLSQLDLLNPTKDSAIQSLIDLEKITFADKIARETEEEMRRDRGRLESFE